MSYRRARQPGEPPSIDPALYRRDDLRTALARHNFSAVYRTLTDEADLSQRRIALLTGQSQSEVSEILSGRQVLTYAVLERIVGGLGIPPELAGMSWHDANGDSAYPGGDPVGETPEGVAETLRRHLLALGGITMVGVPIEGLGELVAELAGPETVPLPSRVELVHVEQVRDLTRRLAEASRAHGSNPEVSSAAVAWATRLLDVPGAEPVKQALLVAVAEAHISAGWAAFDGGLANRAMYQYSRGLKLATAAGDPYLQALALACAGLATVEHGHPDDGLKMLQFAQVKAWDIPPDHARRNAVEAWARADSATALARLGDPEAAYRELAKSRELWRPKRADTVGDLDIAAARIEVSRGRLDAAEPFAAASVRRWDGGLSQGARARANIVLSTIHVRAGESDGLGLAHGAIGSVKKLSSVRARKRLLPLAEALEARPPASDAKDLARMARQVATTRA